MSGHDDGYRDGRLDRLIGLRSGYAWHAFPTEPPYVRDYADGYRRGWLGQPQKRLPPWEQGRC